MQKISPYYFMDKITGTQVSYFLICHRKLWLFGNGICFEDLSDLVYDGRLVHENSYPERSESYEEVAIDGIKVDYYDAKTKVIHEIKRSNKIDKAHIWQLKYYIYVFQQNGILGCSGILEYPLLRRTEEVKLEGKDNISIAKMESEIHNILDSEVCPAKIDKGVCRNCSYYDFCYSQEIDEI